MPKTKQQKQETLQALESGLKKAKSAVFANFQGLTVAEMEELRQNCRKENIKVLVAKKTLVRRVFEALGLTETDPNLFSGGVATFAGADEVGPAKIVSAFAKTHEAAVIFGGLLDGKYVEAGVVKGLAALPGKQELLSQLVGSIHAPVSGFVNVLAGNLRNLVGVLNNIKAGRA